MICVYGLINFYVAMSIQYSVAAPVLEFIYTIQLIHCSWVGVQPQSE